MIKRIFALLLALIMVFSLVACSKTETETDNKVENNKPIIGASNGTYESELFSNNTFIRMFEDSYQYVDKQYNPSETYLTDVDGKIKDYYKGYDGDYFLTDSGLYCSMWGGPHYTSKVDVDINDNTKIVYVGFSFIILADDNGKCEAWEIERKEPNYNPYRFHKLNINAELNGDKLSDAGLTSLYGFKVSDFDKLGITTIRASQDYNGGINVEEYKFMFGEALENEPTEYVVPDGGRGIDGLLIFEDGTAKKVDITEDIDYVEYAALPYPDITNVKNAYPAMGGSVWAVTKQNENDSLYVYSFDNLSVYDMYEYKFDNLPFNTDDIVKCFCPEGYSTLMYVVLNNGKVYKLEMSILCYDTTHDHTDLAKFRKEHDVTSKHVQYTKDGVLDGMFIPTAKEMEDFKNIVTESNVIKAYYLDANLCLIFDDGRNYVYTKGY